MATLPKKSFSKEQVARYRRVFNMFDINKDGVLQAKELAAASKVLGYTFSQEQVMNIMRHFDLDENGVLTFDEFLQAMPGTYDIVEEDEEHWRAECRNKFQQYDVDGNGFISSDEAHTVLSKELGFSSQKTLKMMQQFDINKDGRISYEEFVGFYAKIQQQKKQIDEAFRHFDKEGKGFITFQDACRILCQRFGFSEYDVKLLVEAHDDNADGVLQFEEFKKFWNA